MQGKILVLQMAHPKEVYLLGYILVRVLKKNSYARNLVKWADFNYINISIKIIDNFDIIIYCSLALKSVATV